MKTDKKTIYILSFYLDGEVTIIRFTTADNMYRHYEFLEKEYGDDIKLMTTEFDI